MLPLIDQEPGRQASRHDSLRTWGIDVGVGERLLETFAALAAHAALSDAASPAAGIDSMPLSAVAAAVTGKRDIELLAGLPERFTDDRDQQAVSLFRLYAYRGGSFSRTLFHLSRELRHTLTVLADRSPTPSPTCVDLMRQADDAGLPD
ncbi:hypothetical protein [Streptomyces sp. AM6-12]|uniref:hypothetical protein n=1 Tax=Streptomyces sp. AM6-12 TaxID=3345149 RepID=UPI003793AEEF